MKVAVIIPPKNFTDETLSAVLLVLRKWDVEPVISSYTTSECVGLHGARYSSDINTAKMNPADYDAVLLIDGPGVESYKLPEFKPMLDLVKKFINDGKVIGAVGNSVKVFIRANGFTPGRISMQRNKEIENFARTSRYLVTANGVEVYKNLITASGPENAIEFANAVLDKLHVR